MRLPEIEAVNTLLTDLLGREVKVTRSETGPVIATVASYIDDEGSLLAVVGCDLGLTCSAGAALGLVPRGAVDDAISDGQMDDVLYDNANEIFNIGAQLWQHSTGLHTRWRESAARGPYSADVQSLLKDESADRLYLHVQIPGYPDGYLSLISPMR
ncbi:MAG: hypothetical protein ABSA91_18215 [Acidimicrobiales bacterium]|jgi:hypothetical protein